MDSALVHVDADVVEVFVFFQRKLAPVVLVKSLRHWIAYLRTRIHSYNIGGALLVYY